MIFSSSQTPQSPQIMPMVSQNQFTRMPKSLRAASLGEIAEPKIQGFRQPGTVRCSARPNHPAEPCESVGGFLSPSALASRCLWPQHIMQTPNPRRRMKRHINMQRTIMASGRTTIQPEWNQNHMAASFHSCRTKRAGRRIQLSACIVFAGRVVLLDEGGPHERSGIRDRKHPENPESLPLV